MPNTQQVFPIGRDTWRSRPTVLNAGIDGSGTLEPFQRTANVPWPGGAQVTNIVVASESATPTEVYNIFAKFQGEGTARRIYTLSVTVGVTEFQPVDLFIPPGTDLFATTVAGVDANIIIMLDLYG